MTRFSPLATPSATRAALARHGLAAKKALGQNFLIHDAIVGKICELAQVDAGDDVLEVGPGIGTLTVALCARAGGACDRARSGSCPCARGKLLELR